MGGMIGVKAGLEWTPGHKETGSRENSFTQFSRNLSVTASEKQMCGEEEGGQGVLFQMGEMTTGLQSDRTQLKRRELILCKEGDG